MYYLSFFKKKVNETSAYFLNKDLKFVSLLECHWSFDNRHQKVYIRPSHEPLLWTEGYSGHTAYRGLALAILLL